MTVLPGALDAGAEAEAIVGPVHVGTERKGRKKRVLLECWVLFIRISYHLFLQAVQTNNKIRRHR